MTTDVRQHVVCILDSIKADFPNRKLTAETIMRANGIEEDLQMQIKTPSSVGMLPTFNSEVMHIATPMLKARFDYAGAWSMAYSIWLGADELGCHMQSQIVQLYHTALRENWDDSAPMKFSDDKLTLFGIKEGVPQDLIYIVWCNGGREPEIWMYESYSEHRFSHLVSFLEFVRDRP